jgi:hypothetical protein
MNQLVVRSIGSHWDTKSSVLWFDVKFADGESVQVGVPLAHVVATLDTHLHQLGIQLPPLLGDVESVDGLFSSIARAVSSGVKGVTKAVTKTVNTLDRGVSSVAKVLRSKELGLAMQAFKFVPFVGQAAFSAQQAAQKAAQQYDKGKAAYLQVKATGIQVASSMSDIARGRNIQAAVQRLQSMGNSPEARMALAALQSVS